MGGSHPFGKSLGKPLAKPLGKLLVAKKASQCKTQSGNPLDKPLVAKWISWGQNPFDKMVSVDKRAFHCRQASGCVRARRRLDSGDCRQVSHGSRHPPRFSRMERFNDAGAARTDSCIAHVHAHKLACSTSRVMWGTCKTNVCLVMTI